MATNIDDLDRELASLEGERDGLGIGGAREGMRLLPIVVLLVSIVAVAAVVWYAYNQGVRSGSEEAAPLLRPDGPAKVQPDDPGGLRIPHQDKTVYDTIDGVGEDGPVERILPRAEEPQLPPTETVEERPPAPPSIIDPEPSDTALSRSDSPAPPLPSPELAAPKNLPTVVKAEPATANGAVEEAPKPAPRVTPADDDTTAKPKPAAVQQAAAPAAPGASLTETWRIQVVAAGSETAARSVWATRAGQFPTLLGGKSLQIVKFVKGTKTYYRARGGPFKNRAEAKGACDALKAKNLGCLVVKPGA